MRQYHIAYLRSRGLCRLICTLSVSPLGHTRDLSPLLSLFLCMDIWHHLIWGQGLNLTPISRRHYKYISISLWLRSCSNIHNVTERKEALFALHLAGCYHLSGLGPLTDPLRTLAKGESLKALQQEKMIWASALNNTVISIASLLPLLKL